MTACRQCIKLTPVPDMCCGTSYSSLWVDHPRTQDSWRLMLKALNAQDGKAGADAAVQELA
jgi:hypothetical protein